MPTSLAHLGVTAVVVSFHPELPALARLLAMLLQQVAHVIVVDNASDAWSTEGPLASPRVTVLRQPINVGVARAQNIGLRAARAGGARWLLVLDQDSVPEPDMVSCLLGAHAQATAQGLRVAAVGPAIVEADGSTEGFVRFGSGRYVAVPARAGEAWVPCDMLIASGSLMSASAFDAIGEMDERLFIDKIDTEWSLRASAAGLALLGVPSARLHHRLGERRVRLWFGQWRELSQHKPFRYYYMVRNSLLVRRLPHAHAAWRRADRRQVMSLVLYFGLLAPGRLRALGMMLRGWVDGVRSVSGPLR